MIYPMADKLEKLGSKYGLVIATAKRAKQLKMGVQPAINTDSRNPLTIALEEIALGKIGYDVPDNDLIETSTLEPEVAQLLAIPTRSDEEIESEAAPILEEETPLRIEDEGELEDEGLEEWEDNEEEEVVPLDKHLESGIIIDPDEEDVEETEDMNTLDIEEPKPKGKRGRKPAQPEPDIEEVDIDIDLDADIDVDLGDDDEDTEE